MSDDQDFKTFYFETGFESLVNLVNFIEDRHHVEVGMGSNFINIYSSNTERLKAIERSIRRWNLVDPKVCLDKEEHGE